MTALRRIGPLFALLVSLVVVAGQAHAAERILSFISDVTVERNGDLQVTETITVDAQHDQIRRGILRDFPTIYHRRDGRRVEVGFDVKSVMRDGRAETYTTEQLANGVRIRIGRADAMLSTGRHEFIIRYRTTRQIGYFPEFDELYWNGTGTGWTFPIDVAEVRITLPERVPFTQTAFYTVRRAPPGPTRPSSRNSPAASFSAPPSRCPSAMGSPSLPPGAKACSIRRAGPACSSVPATGSSRRGSFNICRW